LSAITEILDRLSGVEVLKEKLRDTASRVEEWAGRVVELAVVVKIPGIEQGTRHVAVAIPM